MKTISLTQGQFAIVDDADYEELSKYKWFAWRNQCGDFYAVRNFLLKNKKQYRIYMHRQILRLGQGDSRQVDHLNRSTLNNCRSNIRICTHPQNTRNRKHLSNTSSQFKGVTWNKQIKKWGAQITINGKNKHLGYWNMEKVAALAYDMVAIREFGDFAVLNFN